MENVWKRCALLALALLSSAACETLDPLGYFFLRETRKGSVTTGEWLASEGEIRGMAWDTSVFFCSVEVPSGVDWLSDSAYFSQRGRVCLYRNYEKILDLPTGAVNRVSYAADKHHIIGGSLYSEYSDREVTVIKRNGETVLSYEGPELLKGILPEGDDIFTLGQNPVSGKIFYRKNGTCLMELGSGFVTGGFSCSGYGENGALYADGSLVCFGFVSEESTSQTGYIIRNGEMERVCSGSRILDLRSVGGESEYVLYGSGSPRWRNAAFYIKGREVYVGGLTYEGQMSVVFGERIVANGPKESVIYPASSGWTFVSELSARSFGDYSLLNSSCACATAGKTWMALTPRNTSIPPAIAEGGKIRKLDFNGFLAGISVKVSRSIVKGGTDPPER